MSERSGTESRQRTVQVGVRLLPEESERLRSIAQRAGVSEADILRRGAFALARALVLCDQWEKDRTEHPDTKVGRYAAAAVRLCERELRAALAEPGDADA